MKNIYKNMYSEANNPGNIGESLRIKKMLKMIDRLDLENANILDVGCYDGTFLSLIKKRKNNFYGIEANEWGSGEAQGKGIEVNKFFFNDEDPLPYADGFFDVVVAGEIIEHIYDTDFFFAGDSKNPKARR